MICWRVTIFKEEIELMGKKKKKAGEKEQSQKPNEWQL